MGNGVYIQAAAQISVQNPLCDDWLDNPIQYQVPYQRAIEADYRQFLDPVASRRMGRILKRAIATSMTVVASSGITNPEAIIVGTGLGCLETTEKFLLALVQEGEEFLQPTNFINSTHNTIASHIAVHLKCNAYNSTYVHLGVSFESALLDAFMQFQLGRIHSALVGGHDEMIPNYFYILDKVGYWEGKLASECAVSFMLCDEPGNNPMARIREVVLLHNAHEERVESAINQVCERLGTVRKDWITPPSVIPLFGESFTSQAFEMYAAAVKMQRGLIADNILLVNQYRGTETSLIFLSKC
ncbi:MAG: beta-ketoacyl synthase chain length factor [Bacteroidales bacterium]|nr:beta-ketoacyl synthase chain length factor [Bacteroidales bacterium]MDD3522130.1 beta-ketoacyl synthase chain length factor [Bacteroidales bacterium]MDD4030200.1 beta-ketoacyl synthase chain length factor [Bacteroidales bacterium]MDD4435162.1 beta-ketoacyl synthase chain length factor [Bacteroidales bacterium]MDD5733253.1 beta-ketoacyl synthase chain length factor [Bacteroidales bacterium]